MSREQPQANCPVCKTEMAPHARYCGGCGSAIAPTKSRQMSAQVPEENMIGREIVGRYRISAKLGEGGMGAVYRAEQMSLKRGVALKVLRPELSANTDLVRRFNAEAKLAAKLNHPNTVTLYDFGQDEAGALFIAMEYIEGRSLREVLVHEGPLKLQRIIHIASQVCSSLSDAHSAGIIHRDLKPDNVMLSERGRKQDQVTVLDFGIAKLRDIEGDITQQPMTQVGDMLGTPQYMAPEQIRGTEIDARTDIYALGVMLYEMVTSRLPFDGNSVMALLSKHLTEPPTPPIEKRPELDIHPGISNLILRCLEKRPEDRPSTMDEVEEALALFSGAHDVRKPFSPVQASPTQAKWASSTPVPPTVLAQSQPQQSKAHCDAAQNRTDRVAPGRLSTKKKSSFPTWVVPAILIVFAAGGAGAYYAFIHPAEDESAESGSQSNSDNGKFDMSAWETDDGTGANPTPSSESSFQKHTPLGTAFTYSDSTFGYSLEVPSGFVSNGNSAGQASFVGEVAGISQLIAIRVSRDVPNISETRIEKKLKDYLNGIDVQVDHAEWKTIKGLRVLHGESSASGIGSGEFMLTHAGPIYFFVIIGGEDSDDPAIAQFRTSVFLERITLPPQF